MRKKMKKLLLLLLCLLMVQAPVMYLTQPETVQAAAAKKNGLYHLKLSNGKYYYFYYENGKWVKNAWRTVKQNVNGKSVSYRYYFTSSGIAYQAPSYTGMTFNVVARKIGNDWYGFYKNGRMVKSGYYCDPRTETLFYFDANGHYNSAKSAAIRKAGTYKANAAKLRSILGKPISTKTSSSCYGPGKDLTLTYPKIIVSLYRDNNGKEIVLGVYPR